MAVSFKDRAYQHIRAKLLRGGYKAGERLSEESLASEIGISRTPVREALNRLASEGLAKQLPHYGVFVRTFERDEIAELYDLRDMLESYAAFHAAQRRTDAQIAEARAICEGLRAIAHEFRDSGGNELSGELAEGQFTLDTRFHALILTASDCPRTKKAASDLRLLTQLCGRRKFTPGENLLRMLAKTIREHLAIVSALRRRDGEAARMWMSRHVLRGKVERLAAFDRSPETAFPNAVDSLEHYES